MTRSINKKLLVGAAAGALLFAGAATAEVDTVNLAQQFGLLYVPLHVVMDQKLVEKHAKKMGIPVPKIKMYKISGGANINRALLAKTIDFGAHGVGPALKLWAFPDGIEEAAKVGVTAIIQPGGSIRDEEVIAAADAHDMAMVMTGTRQFRH